MLAPLLLATVFTVPAFAAAPPEGPETVVVETWRRPPPPPPPPRRPLPPPRRGPPPPPPADFDASVTVAFHDMGVPMLGGTVEFKASPRVGLALDGGATSFYGIGVYDIGAQARLYGIGDFDRGLFIAAAAGATNADPLQVGSGVGRVGAWIGGKYAFGGGFTIEGAFGAHLYADELHAVVAPAGNLGIGVSF